MFDKLKDIDLRYQELNEILSNPDIVKSPDLYKKYTKERADIVEIVMEYRRFKDIKNQIEDNKKLLHDSDDEMKDLAKDELAKLDEDMTNCEDQLKILLLPKDPNDEKNILLEIRAGAGGDEAALFGANLFRMYSRYADMRRWRVEIMSENSTGAGGFKEIIALIEGRGAYSRLKYESGVHRVQRVPETEAQGRIHTSTVTVAILPEAEEIEVEISPNDLRIDTYRASGHGGQHINVTDSAVRITHLPTNLVVTCQDEKSQHKNKAKAMKVLRARLLDLITAKQHSERSETRKSQVGTGDRSERIRTYNFPQTRVTDHRIGLTLYKLEMILLGNLDELIEPLITHYQAESLKSQD